MIINTSSEILTIWGHYFKFDLKITGAAQKIQNEDTEIISYHIAQNLPNHLQGGDLCCTSLKQKGLTALCVFCVSGHLQCDLHASMYFSL